MTRKDKNIDIFELASDLFDMYTRHVAGVGKKKDVYVSRRDVVADGYQENGKIVITADVQIEDNDVDIEFKDRTVKINVSDDVITADVPPNVNVEDATFEYNNGVLIVEIPME